VCSDADERENVDLDFSLDTFWTRIGKLLYCILLSVVNTSLSSNFCLF